MASPAACIGIGLRCEQSKLSKKCPDSALFREFGRTCETHSPSADPGRGPKARNPDTFWSKRPGCGLGMARRASPCGRNFGADALDAIPESSRRTARPPARSGAHTPDETPEHAVCPHVGMDSLPCAIAQPHPRSPSPASAALAPARLPSSADASCATPPAPRPSPDLCRPAPDAQADTSSPCAPASAGAQRASSRAGPLASHPRTRAHPHHPPPAPALSRPAGELSTKCKAPARFPPEPVNATSNRGNISGLPSAPRESPPYHPGADAAKALSPPQED